MPELIWYRSLYWRIALGFVGLVAALLVLQGMVFLWLTGRTAELLPGRSPAEFAQSIASDLSAAISANPALDIDAYLHGRYTSAFRSFAVVTTDGRTILSRHVVPPPNIAWAARGRLLGARGPRMAREAATPRAGDPLVGDTFGSGRGVYGRAGSGFGRGGEGVTFEFAQITVGGAPYGIVAVPLGTPPLSITLQHLGPALAAVALSLLIVGTAVAALVVFRPTHRRLRALQEATRALGEGQSGVRAVESGGDEVTSLARGFNEMAAALEKRNEELAHADRMRRQLLADISHELTTPLAAIRGYVETLGMPDIPLDDHTRARYLRIVTDETERLDHIVGDLLDLAKLEGGGGSLKHEPVAIAQLLERVHHRHAPLLRDHHISLETIQGPGIDVVLGDGNRLEQALQNLVSNAVRHTPAGGHIDVRAENAGARVRFVVEDSGPGISAEHLPHIFDRFYKADESRTGTDTPSGSGLGLSIVRAIVERHGGTVSASNAAGGGARFEILLPRGDRAESSEESPA
jgi:two-component system OmpR family sensor kinase